MFVIFLQLTLLNICKASLHEEEFQALSNPIGFSSWGLCCFPLYKLYKIFFLDESCRELDERSYEYSGHIMQLPTEVIWKLSYSLSPNDILSLCKTGYFFKIIINNSFWNTYIKYHNYSKWSSIPELPLIKVTFANYWYKQGIDKGNYGLVKRAARLGYPEAMNQVRTKDKHHQDLYEYIYDSNSHYLWNHYYNRDT